MLTDTQAGGGVSLSGSALRKGAPAQAKGAEARSQGTGAFSAILAETGSTKVGSDTPAMPQAGGDNADTAPPDAGGSLTGETENPATWPPDTGQQDASAAPAAEAPRAAPTARVMTEQVAMSRSVVNAERSQAAAPGELAEHAGSAPGPTAPGHTGSRDPAAPAPVPDSTAGGVTSARSGKEAGRGDTQPASVADRPAQTVAVTRGAAPRTAAAQAEPSRGEPVDAAALPARAPTPPAGVGVALPRVTLAPGELSRPGSDPAPSTLSSLSGREAATRAGEHGRSGRHTGATMTGSQSPALSGLPQAGQTPLAGGSGLSFSAPLAQAELAGTSDAGPAASDGRGMAQTAQITSAAPPSTMHRHDLAQQVVVQIAAAAERTATGTGRTLDVHLNPEELGRVRLRISPSESGLSVVVLAERGETLDLLRRNIDMLARDFLEIGYEGATFDFAEGHPDTGDGHVAPSLPMVADAAGPAPENPADEPNLLALGDRLDIRL